MNIPGLNLLNAALGVIASQKVEYIAFVDNDINLDGSKIPLYADPQPLYGSFQPVNNELKKYLGLDLPKNYAKLFARHNLLDVERDMSSDRIRYAGRTYQIVSAVPWYAQDGWKEVLLVEIKDAG